jgi:hypothetical protein
MTFGNPERRSIVSVVSQIMPYPKPASVVAQKGSLHGPRVRSSWILEVASKSAMSVVSLGAVRFYSPRLARPHRWLDFKCRKKESVVFHGENRFYSRESFQASPNRRTRRQSQRPDLSVFRQIVVS